MMFDWKLLLILPVVVVAGNALIGYASAFPIDGFSYAPQMSGIPPELFPSPSTASPVPWPAPSTLGPASSPPIPSHMPSAPGLSPSEPPAFPSPEPYAPVPAPAPSSCEIKGAYWNSSLAEILPPAEIPTSYFTHIFYAFVQLDATTYQLSITQADEQWMGNFTSTLHSKLHQTKPFSP